MDALGWLTLRVDFRKSSDGTLRERLHGGRTMQTKYPYAKLLRDAFEWSVCAAAVFVIGYNLAVFGVI